jgi:hypothetical protein
MAIANTKTYGYHLDGDVNKMVFQQYTLRPSEYDKLFKVQNAPPGGHYTEGELSGLGPFQTKTEGGSINYDNPVERTPVERGYTAYALGFQITEEMMKDDLQRNFMKMPSELGRSAALKKETKSFDLFNNGFATHKAWDGNYLFVASGRTLLKEGSAQNNRPDTDASLSETSLNRGFEYYDTLKDASGRPSYEIPRTLLIPVQLRAVARNLLMTPNKPGSMDNDINTVKDYGNWNIHISRHLTSSTAWFLLGENADLRMYVKKNLQVESADDFDTGNACFKGTMRFLVFSNDPTNLYGTTGT